MNRHYKKPPVMEAVIDIRCQLPAEPSHLVSLNNFCNEIKDSFGAPALIQSQITEFQAGTNPEDSSIRSKQTDEGYRLDNAAADRVLQVTRTGFTYSHLPPYVDGDKFIDEARSFWDIYTQICNPSNVSRVALRYINQIVIPQEKIEIEDYFQLYPNIPKSIPQDINKLFMNVLMPQIDIDKDAYANINFAFQGSHDLGSIAFILDFDLHKTFPNSTANSDALWQFIGLFKKRKNELFEASITDLTREIFS